MWITKSGNSTHSNNWTNICGTIAFTMLSKGLFNLAISKLLNSFIKHNLIKTTEIRLQYASQFLSSFLFGNFLFKLLKERDPNYYNAVCYYSAIWRYDASNRMPSIPYI